MACRPLYHNAGHCRFNLGPKIDGERRHCGKAVWWSAVAIADGAFPDAMNEFFGLPLNSEQRRKILWENCARLYAIEPPSQALTAPQASAAE
jgi:hypothetical protein